MANKRQKKKHKIRCMALANGAIHTIVKGSKKGKKGYNRKNKSWRNET
jgi:hypothetical protein